MTMQDVAPFTISRSFIAPRELLFRVNAEPEHLARWLSPQGFTTLHAAMDLRSGGAYHYGLSGPNGMEMWGKLHYLEIIPSQKLEYLQSFSDRDGGLTRHPMFASRPLEVHSTMLFEDDGDERTRLTISCMPHTTANEIETAAFDAAYDSMRGGFSGMLDALEAYLAELQAR